MRIRKVKATVTTTPATIMYCNPETGEVFRKPSELPGIFTDDSAYSFVRDNHDYADGNNVVVSVKPEKPVTIKYSMPVSEFIKIATMEE